MDAASYLRHLKAVREPHRILLQRILARGVAPLSDLEELLQQLRDMDDSGWDAEDVPKDMDDFVDAVRPGLAVIGLALEPSDAQLCLVNTQAADDIAKTRHGLSVWEVAAVKAIVAELRDGDSRVQSIDTLAKLDSVKPPPRKSILPLIKRLVDEGWLVPVASAVPSTITRSTVVALGQRSAAELGIELVMPSGSPAAAVMSSSASSSSSSSTAARRPRPREDHEDDDDDDDDDAFESRDSDRKDDDDEDEDDDDDVASRRRRRPADRASQSSQGRRSQRR